MVPDFSDLKSISFLCLIIVLQIKFNSMVNYDWELKYYRGCLIAVSSKCIAYALRGIVYSGNTVTKLVVIIRNMHQTNKSTVKPSTYLPCSHLPCLLFLGL